jgi:hypothetical protein
VKRIKVVGVLSAEEDRKYYYCLVVVCPVIAPARYVPEKDYLCICEVEDNLLVGLAKVI